MNENYKWLELIPSGWIGLAREMVEKCETIDSTYTVEDMKEKWGALDVYSYHYGNDEQNKLINNIEHQAWDKSYHTCVKCGKPATKLSTGWILPWCDECGKDKEKYYKRF